MLARGDPRVLTAVVGVKDLVVVTTKDAVLVTTHERCQDVKVVVDELKKQGVRQLFGFDDE